MSIRAVRLVFDSALASHLKTTLAALLTYGHDGEQMRPSLDRLAWSIGKSDRQVRADLAELLALGVLALTGDRRGGRRRTAEYRLVREQLPPRPPFKGGSEPPPLRPVNPEADFRVSRGNPEVDSRVSGEKPGSVHRQNPEVCDTKPGSGLPPIVDLDLKPSIEDQDPPLRGATRSLSTPDRPNVRALRALANAEILRNRTHDFGPGETVAASEGLKGLAAQRGMPYDGRSVDAALNSGLGMNRRLASQGKLR